MPGHDRPPIDDRILKVLEKNSGQRQGSQSMKAQASSGLPRKPNPAIPLLLALVPAGILLAATVLMRPSTQQAEPTRAPIIPQGPSEEPGGKPPASSPTGKPDGQIQGKASPTDQPGGADRAPSASGGTSAAGPVGTSGQAGARGSAPSGDGGSPTPATSVRREPPSAPAWGQGSSAAPPPPANLSIPLPAPGNGMKDHSRLPLPIRATLTATAPQSPSTLC